MSDEDYDEYEDFEESDEEFETPVPITESKRERESEVVEEPAEGSYELDITNKIGEENLESSTSAVTDTGGKKSPEELAAIAFKAAFWEIGGETGSPYVETVVNVIRYAHNFVNLNVSLLASVAWFFVYSKYIKKSKSSDEMIKFIKSYTSGTSGDEIYKKSSDLIRYIRIYTEAEKKANKA